MKLTVPSQWILPIIVGVAFLVFHPMEGRCAAPDPSYDVQSTGIQDSRDIQNSQSNQKISLNLKEADLLDIFKMFSEKMGWNLIIGEEVAGKVSLNLHDVNMEEALAAVVNASGFAIERKGNILFIRATDKLQSPSFPQAMEHKAYKLYYADPEEVGEVIKKYLSPIGKVTVHKASSTLFIDDLHDHMLKMESLLKEMDQIPQQVLIEAKIMEVRLTDDTALGIDWNGVFKSGALSGTLQTSGFANLPGGGNKGFFFSLTTPDVTALLDTLQQKGVMNTLATPKILALNHKPAQIVIGGRLGYRVTTTTNQVTTESVEFLDIGTQLRLVPHIDDLGNILMEIHPEISDGAVTAGLPSKTTTEVTTTLLSRDGETVFIGGLIRDRKEEISDQFPGLGNIPLLGYLFKRYQNKNSKTEIIVLITPHLGRAPEIQNGFSRRFDSLDLPISILSLEHRKTP